MKTTIQIKSTSGDVLYEHTCEDNSVKKTVGEQIEEAAVFLEIILATDEVKLETK